MRVINVKELFKRLITLEYELLKYINKLQGSDSRPLDFCKAAETLKVDRRAIYGAVRRLVNAGALIAVGENFKINEDIYKQ